MEEDKTETPFFAELDKSKAKIKEMERTIKWWSDSTASWRDKWGKVKAEKHKYKEESRLLRGRNEALTRELNKAKIISQELLSQKEILRTELTRVNSELRKYHNGKQLAIVEPTRSFSPDLQADDEQKSVRSGFIDDSSIYDSTIPKFGEEQAFFDQIMIRSDNMKRMSNSGVVEFSIGSEETMLLRQTICECQKRLALKTREYESAMSENIKLMKAVEELEKKNEEFQTNPSSANEDLSSLRQCDEGGKGVGGRSSSRGGYLKEMKMREMRQQVERLQNENSQEWSKREKLESENTRLDRELKQMALKVHDLEQEVRHKSDMVANAQSAGMKCLQTELDEKAAQLAELKISSNRLKKQLQERDEEVHHEKKRSEQRSDEVRKLRQRIEELKRQLTEAEERADNQSNGTRRMQRSLDEQTQQTDNLQMQINYLTTRLKRQSITSRTVKDLTDGVSDEDSSDV